MPVDELDARGRRLRAALAVVLVRENAPELRRQDHIQPPLRDMLSYFVRSASDVHRSAQRRWK